MARDSLPSNLFDLNRSKAERKESQPYTARTLRIIYGVVADVSEDTYQVKVVLDNGKLVGRNPLVGDWLSLITPLDDILLRWGPLRKGLKVKVFYYGETHPQKGMVEIIGDEYFTFVKQNSISEGGVGVHKLFSPKFP